MQFHKGKGVYIGFNSQIIFAGNKACCNVYFVPIGYQTQLPHSAEEKAACELWWKKTFWNLFQIKKT